MALTVLFLAANVGTAERPAATGWLRLDREVTQVRAALARAPGGARIDLQTAWAATWSDLLAETCRVRPDVLHLSGHGRRSGLVVESGRSDPAIVPFDVLASVLGATDSPPRLVVLNVCHSARAARAVLAAVPAMVGMREQILDDAAVTFAATFYAALGHGQPVSAALDQARPAMVQRGYPDDAALPQAESRADIDLTTYRLFDVAR